VNTPPDWNIAVDQAAITILGPLSYRVLQILWSAARPLTPNDLYLAFAREESRLAPTTISTTLYRLVERGYIRRVQHGFYAAALSEAELRQAVAVLIVGHLLRDYSPETRQALADAGWRVLAAPEEPQP